MPADTNTFLPIFDGASNVSVAAPMTKPAVSLASLSAVSTSGDKDETHGAHTSVPDDAPNDGNGFLELTPSIGGVSNASKAPTTKVSSPAPITASESAPTVSGQ